MSALTTLLAHAGPHDLTTGDGVVHALTAPGHLLTAALAIAAGYAAYGVCCFWTSRTRRKGDGTTPSPSGRSERIWRLPASGQG